ncbi:SLC13 family permease [Piscibacillus halophilus]|uniref:SLC13 family permease n=1 Tax=Piscibacillus halophilus TaxID=571933 RepID=UPI00158E7FF0|nr:SLC13 family permease [Piscibacillus halophilus]
MKQHTHTKAYNRRQIVGLILGPTLFVMTLLFLSFEGMSSEAQAILASTLWIATWWVTEAIPIAATALLPIILFPLTGGLDLGDTTSAYGDDIIFLFMGGFIIALAMERWNLHKRIALTIITVVGTSLNRLILGFMIATAFLSMWISNTATAMMMIPIGSAIIYKMKESAETNSGDVSQDETKRFSKALMLSIAYSASIGGLGTLIGTPPNALFAGVVNNIFDVTISFATWMLFGVPIVIIMLAVAWLYLVKVAFPLDIGEFPGGNKVIQDEKHEIGHMATEEKIVLTVFSLTAVAWITRSFILEDLLPGIDDAVIAITGALVLFLIPAKNKKGEFIMDWETSKRLPWGILILFGGGLAIAAGFSETGLAQWIGEQLTGLQGLNFVFIVTIITGIVILLTEISSNTATATMLLPIMASLAAAINVHPYSLMIAGALAASCAFMLPVATPPNAVVFGSGYLRIEDMAKAGIWLNVMSIIMITVAIYLLLPITFGLDLFNYPF